MPTADDHSLHEAFLASTRRHILMDTHGIHQWQVVPGLPDTGGQNVFVNQFTDTLADLGYKVTIANRGGYPHPTTGDMHTGIRYQDAHRRIVYLEDDTAAFVRKEDMAAQIPGLVRFLAEVLESEDQAVDLIISHYWDGADIGVQLNQLRGSSIPHIWVPHSLGTVKKRNMDPSTWQSLRIDERIARERELVPLLDATAATSSVIRQALIEDYGAKDPLFLPPCVQAERYHQRPVADDHAVWNFIAEHNPAIDVAALRQGRVITEISRTDKTKRKDVLIRSFAAVAKDHPDTYLLVSVDPTEAELAAELKALVEDAGLNQHIVFLGNVWDMLPWIYAITDIYCSPSVMEGFGMAVQEAAATQVPVISSHLVPFVCEYLLGDTIDQRPVADASALQVGEGAIVVQADEVAGFAAAIRLLLEDETLRRTMGQRAHAITIPYFTWSEMVKRCFERVDAIAHWTTEG